MKALLSSTCPPRNSAADVKFRDWHPVLLIVKDLICGLATGAAFGGLRLNFNCVTPSCTTALAGDAAPAVNCTATWGWRGSSVCKSRQAVSVPHAVALTVTLSVAV